MPSMSQSDNPAVQVERHIAHQIRLTRCPLCGSPYEGICGWCAFNCFDRVTETDGNHYSEHCATCLHMSETLFRPAVYHGPEWTNTDTRITET